MDVATALQKCGGAARTPKLHALGVRDSGIRAAHDRALIRRVGRGAYALPGAPPALVTAVGLCAVVSHGSAAALHGLPVWRPSAVLELTVPRNTHPTAPPGVRVHRADLRDDERDPYLAVTSVERTVLDCGRTMPLLDGLVVLDGAVRKRLVTKQFLEKAAGRSTGPGATALRRAVAHVDLLAESPLESVLGLLADILGHQVRRQVWLPGVGSVDIIIDGWLVLEGDGFEFHSNRADYRKDRRRGNRLALHGLVLLRFTYEDVRYHPLRTLALIETALRLGPPRR